jgi:hypothetical protein
MENALASCRVQRVLVTQQRPSRVMVKCDSDDFKHLIAAIFPHKMLQRSSVSFWTSATCLVWNSRTNHCKSSIWAAWEKAGPAKVPGLLRNWLPGNVTSSGQSFSRYRPLVGLETDEKTKGKVDLTKMYLYFIWRYFRIEIKRLGCWLHLSSTLEGFDVSTEARVHWERSLPWL